MKYRSSWLRNQVHHSQMVKYRDLDSSQIHRIHRRHDVESLSGIRAFTSLGSIQSSQGHCCNTVALRPTVIASQENRKLVGGHFEVPRHCWFRASCRQRYDCTKLIVTPRYHNNRASFDHLRRTLMIEVAVQQRSIAWVKLNCHERSIRFQIACMG